MSLYFLLWTFLYQIFSKYFSPHWCLNNYKKTRHDLIFLPCIFDIQHTQEQNRCSISLHWIELYHVDPWWSQDIFKTFLMWQNSAVSTGCPAHSGTLCWPRGLRLGEGGTWRRGYIYIKLQLLHVVVWQKPTHYVSIVKQFSSNEKISTVSIYLLSCRSIKYFLMNFWGRSNILFSCSVAQSCLTLCNPTDCSIRGLPVICHLSEPAQTHVHWVSDAIQTISSSVIPFSCLPPFLASGSFPMS